MAADFPRDIAYNTTLRDPNAVLAIAFDLPALLHGPGGTARYVYGSATHGPRQLRTAVRALTGAHGKTASLAVVDKLLLAFERLHLVVRHAPDDGQPVLTVTPTLEALRAGAHATDPQPALAVLLLRSFHDGAQPYLTAARAGAQFAGDGLYIDEHGTEHDVTGMTDTEYALGVVGTGVKLVNATTRRLIEQLRRDGGAEEVADTRFREAHPDLHEQIRAAAAQVLRHGGGPDELVAALDRFSSGGARMREAQLAAARDACVDRNAREVADAMLAVLAAGKFATHLDVCGSVLRALAAVGVLERVRRDVRGGQRFVLTDHGASLIASLPRDTDPAAVALELRSAPPFDIAYRVAPADPDAALLDAIRGTAPDAAAEPIEWGLYDGKREAYRYEDAVVRGIVLSCLDELAPDWRPSDGMRAGRDANGEAVSCAAGGGADAVLRLADGTTLLVEASGAGAKQPDGRGLISRELEPVGRHLRERHEAGDPGCTAVLVAPTVTPYVWTHLLVAMLDDDGTVLPIVCIDEARLRRLVTYRVPFGPLWRELTRIVRDEVAAVTSPAAIPRFGPRTHAAVTARIDAAVAHARRRAVPV